MKKATRFFAGAVCCLALGAGMGAFAGCGGKSEEIVVGGSSSVSPLMSVLALNIPYSIFGFALL